MKKNAYKLNFGTSIDEGVSPEVMDILPEAPVQSEPEGSFVREIFDNYRSIASAILNAFGCRERFCADEKCSNLDGTALMIIHLLFIKILTGFALHWYKNDYTDKTKKFIYEKVDEIRTKVSRSAESGWGN